MYVFFCIEQRIIEHVVLSMSFLLTSARPASFSWRQHNYVVAQAHLSLAVRDIPSNVRNEGQTFKLNSLCLLKLVFMNEL